MSESPESGVDLLWLPLGAGDPSRLVRTSGWCYERLVAARQHRAPLRLFHAALDVWVEGTRHTVEVAPRWSGPRHAQGEVVRGPVFTRLLGRTRWFQYEIRSWRDGVIPDRQYAIDSPVQLSRDARRAASLLAEAPGCPAHTWGRDALGAGDMWNSNSVVAWLLVVSGHDAATITPPAGGRAPGWAAGVAAAHPA